MNRTRIIEIIEAYGGYAAAWPDDERDEAAAFAAGDFGLCTMIEDAKALDRDLRDWACELLPTTAAEADAAATRALADGAAVHPVRRWLPRAAVSGALAASLAVGAILFTRSPSTPVGTVTLPETALALGRLPGENVEAAQDMLVWGSVFTPTPEEEMVL